MAISNIKEQIPSGLRKVWDFVLDVKNYGAERSDLSKTEIINEFHLYFYLGFVFKINFSERKFQ